MTKPAATGSEKRNNPRIMALNLVSYEADRDPAGDPVPPAPPGVTNREGLGRTRNVSEGGILLEVARPYPLSAVLDLRIALGEKIISPKARVVRLQELAGNRVEMGLKFIELSKTDLETIQGFIGTRPDDTP